MSLFDKLKSWLGAKPPAPANDGDTSHVDDAAAEGGSAPEASPSPEPEAAPRDPGEQRRSTPQSDARLEADGRALFDAGDAAAAISLLGERGILFARHEATALPCLCRKCLRAAVSAAESGGVAYLRDFVVTKHRVFFYWMPSELADAAKQVRASMRGEVRSRLRVIATKEDQPRQSINPFTKQPITILPKHERRRRNNPFTGKPMP